MNARLILACLALAPSLAAAQSTQEIFHIDRGANKNVVRYDARIGKDGQLDSKEPVVAYRKGTDGKTWPLTAIDFKFFYGFKVRKDKSGDFWHLSLVAAKDRPLKLFLLDGRPRAAGKIAGVVAYLEKLFVKFAENKVIPAVSYIDLIGVEASTGRPVQERVVP